MKKHLYFQRTDAGMVEVCDGGQDFAPCSKSQAERLLAEFYGAEDAAAEDRGEGGGTDDDV